MARWSNRETSALAWWALARFAFQPSNVTNNADLLQALTELGLDSFRALQGRFLGQSWRCRASEPAGRWVQRLREELAPMAFQEADPRSCWDRPWDQVWRLVAYDVPSRPHARRQKLWRWLKQNRLGMLQRSLWISAKPLNEIKALFHDVANSHTLLLWEAQTPSGLHPVTIVEQAWDLAGVNSDYQAVLNLTSEPPNPENVRQATLQWQKAVQADPLLPRSLYPKSFRGFRATDQLEKMWVKFRNAGK